MRFWMLMGSGLLIGSLVWGMERGSGFGDEPWVMPPQVSLTDDGVQGTSLVIEVPQFPLASVQVGGEEVVVPAWEEEATTCQVGFPALPMISRMVLVHPTAGIHLDLKRLKYEEKGPVSLLFNPSSDQNSDEPGEPSPQFRELEGWWPSQPVVVSEPMIMRGHRLVVVTFFPIQVQPATGKVRFNEMVEFQLLYQGEGVNPVLNPDRPRPSRTFDRILENLVINPPPRDRGMPGRGTYLVVYNNAQNVRNTIQPLLDWRSRQGWEVRTIAVQGNQSADQVKQLIQNAYNQWPNPPEMLCIIGDATGSFPVPAWEGVTDFRYAQLDGNDMLADLHFGRISAEDIQTLQRIISRLVSYEADPYMEDTNWFRAGMVVAGSATSGISTISINKWVKREVRDRWGVNDVHEWYYSAPYQGQTVPQFFTNEFQRGILFSTYRGWIGMEGTDVNTIMNFRANQRMPFATIITCNTGTFPTSFSQSEAFLRSPGGAVGCVGMSTAGTHTAYNNALFGGMWQAVLKLGMCEFGAFVNFGRYELVRQYAAFGDGQYTNFIIWCNLMGDPATHVWTGVPRLLEVERPQTLSPGANRVEIRVFGQEDEEPIAGAQVCLWKPDEQYQEVDYTDSEGVVIFTLPPGGFSEGELLLTVTGHNLKPYRGTIAIQETPLFVAPLGWEIIRDDDQNGVANPGETVTLQVRLKNFGSETIEGGFRVLAVSASPWVAVVEGDVAVNGDLEPQATVDVEMRFDIDSSAPDQLALPVELLFHKGNEDWSGRLFLIAEAPRPRIGAVRFQPAGLERGAVRSVELVINNDGHFPLEDFTLTAWTDTRQVTFIEPRASYSRIQPGQSRSPQEPTLRLRAHPFAIPGLKFTIWGAIEDRRGFRDTVSVQVRLDPPGENDPFGPDQYGYVCFDSGDEGWEQKPTYQWIEIDPNVQGFDFRGTDTRLSDAGNNDDKSAVINLPVPLTYYGRPFDRITINTNGWVAFGDWSDIVSPRNRRIGSGEGPNAALFPFWDDLTTGRILYYWDQPRGRFIIEWNNMQSFGGNVGPQIFEAIIYQNGDIIFQYKRINNSSQEGSSRDTPYATVGIANLDNTDGLEYTYYNTYPRGARRLQNEMAIKFTTNLEYRTGVLAGHITDYATGMPIERAQVITTRGFWAETDQDGRFLIDDILIGSGYSLTVSKPGYNDSTWTGPEGQGFTINEGETLWVDIALLHPEFVLDRESLEFEMLPDSTTQTSLMLFNGGNGTLTFTSRFVPLMEEGRATSGNGDGMSNGSGLSRDEPNEQWDMLLQIDAGRIVQDNALQSVAFIGDYWVVAGGFNRVDTLNYFYFFTPEGEYVDRVPQPIGGQYGVRDIEFYQGSLWCATNSSLLLRVNPLTGGEERRWDLGIRNFTPRNITVDPTTGEFYLSGLTGQIYRLRLENDSAWVVVRTYSKLDPRDGGTIRESGLAWFRDDPEGFNLYLISNNEPVPNPDRADVSLYKLNPETGEIRFLTDFSWALPAGASGRGGMTITPRWSNRVWAVAALFDNRDEDFVAVFELAPNSSWIEYSPRSGTLMAGDQLPIEFLISSAFLDTGLYGVKVQFRHNAMGAFTEVPITLHVTDTLIIPQVNEKEALPAQWALEPSFPNPFNAFTIIKFALPEEALVRLEVFDLTGRRVAVLINEQKLSAGRYSISWDARGLPGGVYLYRLLSPHFTAIRKVVLVK